MMGRQMLSRPEQGLYWCGACKSLLPKHLFSESKGRSTGVHSRCRVCASSHAQEWNRKNKERHAESLRKHREKESAKQNAKAWREENRQRLNSYMKQWREQSSYAVFSRGRVRASRAIPPWANLQKIAEIYEAAKRKQAESGIEHHVDHQVPLNGKNVCGLHVENNLQIITAQENWCKRNKFEEYAT